VLWTQPLNLLRKKDGKMTNQKELFVYFQTVSVTTSQSSSAKSGVLKIKFFPMTN